MTKTVEEFVEKYDDWAPDYDDENDCEERRTCISLIADRADPGPDDTVLDVGTGTGDVALALADEADRVVGRDISEAMLEQAREKAAARSVENVTFGVGRFREPDVDETVDLVVSNFALHHLSDEAKREAIESIAALGPRKLVFGEGMYFEGPDPAEPFFSTESVYPSTVGYLVAAVTDAGFAVTDLERVHDQIGVLVAEAVE